MRRREILKTAMLLAAGQLARADAVRTEAAPAAGTGPARAFDFAWLKGQARYLAVNSYLPPKDVLPEAMATLGYDQYQALRFRADHALWND